MRTFWLVRWQLGTEREGMWESWQLLNPLKSFDGHNIWQAEAMSLFQQVLVVDSLLFTKSMYQYYLKV